MAKIKMILFFTLSIPTILTLCFLANKTKDAILNIINNQLQQFDSTTQLIMITTTLIISVLVLIFAITFKPTPKK